MTNSTYIIEQNNDNKTVSSIYNRIVFTTLACIMTSLIVSTITIYLVMTFVSRKASDLANIKILSFFTIAIFAAVMHFVFKYINKKEISVTEKSSLTILSVYSVLCGVLLPFTCNGNIFHILTVNGIISLMLVGSLLAFRMSKSCKFNFIHVLIPFALSLFTLFIMSLSKMSMPVIVLSLIIIATLAVYMVINTKRINACFDSKDKKDIYLTGLLMYHVCWVSSSKDKNSGSRSRSSSGKWGW